MSFVVPMTAMNARWNLTFSPEGAATTQKPSDAGQRSNADGARRSEARSERRGMQAREARKIAS